MRRFKYLDYIKILVKICSHKKTLEIIKLSLKNKGSKAICKTVK